MNNKIKIGDIVRYNTNDCIKYAIIVKLKKNIVTVKDAENKISQTLLSYCSKIKIPAIKISTKDFDEIRNGNRIYKHEMTNTWKHVLAQQPELIKFYARHRAAIVCKNFNCYRLLKDPSKYHFPTEKLKEEDFYIKAYVRRIPINKDL